MRAVEALVVEEGLELLAQHVTDGTTAGDQIGRPTVAGQVDEHDLAVLGEPVQHRVPGLPAVRDTVHQDQGFAGTVPLGCEQVTSSAAPTVG